jgi:hypothetical protein
MILREAARPQEPHCAVQAFRKIIPLFRSCSNAFATFQTQRAYMWNEISLCCLAYGQSGGQSPASRRELEMAGLDNRKTFAIGRRHAPIR